MQDGAQPVEELNVPGVGQVVDDDADGSGAPFGEAARDRVGSVAQFGDGVEHGLPFRLGDMRGILQDQRYQ